MSVKKYNGIWVFAEARYGDLQEVSLELLGKAQELAAPAHHQVTAVLLGHHVRPQAQVLINYGADAVLVADDPKLHDYRVIPYALVIEGLIKEYQPEIFLLGATSMGVELAPRVAAKVRTGLSAHCIDLKLDPQGQLLQVVPGWEGGVLATITCPEHRPQMATVMPGAMRALSPVERQGEIKDLVVDLPEEKMGPEILDIQKEKPETKSLEKAEVVVAGGWGVGSQENWQSIEELARVLGGAVGATRPAVDEGWGDENQMIGQSGKTVRPNLYIAIGISGVMHHVVGMDQAKHIISINQDPNAAIFDVSDVIVIEDYRKILPKLIEALHARRQG